MATYLPSPFMADNVTLRVTAAGIAEIKDGALSADAAGRAKMADGFLTAIKAAAGFGRVATGAYTGTGADLSVTGLGFAPVLVIIFPTAVTTVTNVALGIKSAAGYRGWLPTSAANAVGDLNKITLDADGFTIVDESLYSINLRTYAWLALGAT